MEEPWNGQPRGNLPSNDPIARMQAVRPRSGCYIITHTRRAKECANYGFEAQTLSFGSCCSRLLTRRMSASVTGDDVITISGACRREIASTTRHQNGRSMCSGVITLGVIREGLHLPHLPPVRIAAAAARHAPPQVARPPHQRRAAERPM